MSGTSIYYSKIDKMMVLEVYSTFFKFTEHNLIELIDLSCEPTDRAHLLNALKEYVEKLERYLSEEAYHQCL